MNTNLCVKNFCIDCDEYTMFDTVEDDEGYLACFCRRCGAEMYVPEAENFNARLADIKRKRKLISKDGW